MFLSVLWTVLLLNFHVKINEAYAVNKYSYSTIHLSSAISPNCIADIDFNFIKIGTAGALAGGFRGLSRVITFPWDTVKTLEQVKGAPGVTKKLSNLSLSDYFSGLVPTTVVAMPANAVFFIVYNYLDMIVPCIASSDILPAWLRRITVALIATLPQNAIKIPAEVVKQRAQVQDELGSFDIIKEISASEGIAGFYVGSSGMLLREIPYNAFQMAFYSTLKDSLFYPESQLNGLISISLQAAVLGVAASFLSAILTQPADVIKTRLMTDSKALGARPTLYGELVRILNDEGVIGLYAGLRPRVLLCTVGGLIYFYIAQYVDNNFFLS